jgi:quinone-modifying oxidoreductase subunit QmoC
MLGKDRLEEALGIAGASGEPIVFSYSPMLPHWILNSLFGFFGLLAVVGATVSVVRFWRALKHGESTPAVKGVWASAVAVVRRIFLHERFTKCATEHSRSIAHLLLFFGFLALTAVTFWVITGPINPLVREGFAYPFGFLNPWKILANVGGLAVFVGCVLMIWERLYESETVGASNFFDWALLWTILAVVVTGFVTEVMHFLRMVPHRHVVYFVHLVCVFALLIYLPYSKFAHLLYRATAMVYAEHVGRDTVDGSPSTQAAAAEPSSGA